MHIQDGLLDVKTCVGTAVVSVSALGYAIHRVQRSFADRSAPLMGVMAACLFAAQMMNFPIPGGTSGHLLGGVLAAVMLGPSGGLLVLTVVLAVQCVLFQDGGITALGANIFNVGVIGSLVGFAIFDPIRRWIGGYRGTVAAAVVAAWFSVVLGATACSVELGLSGTYRLGPTLGVMLLVHSIIGLCEALITGFAIVFVLRTRPDLVYGQTSESGVLVKSGQVVLAGLAIALVVAVLLSPFASQLPDGLDWSMEKLGVEPQATSAALKNLTEKIPMPDYKLSGIPNLNVAGSLAGAIGTLTVFVVAFLMSRGLSSKTTIAHTPHAS